jgi:hypothetical protein
LFRWRLPTPEAEFRGTPLGSVIVLTVELMAVWETVVGAKLIVALW